MQCQQLGGSGIIPQLSGHSGWLVIKAIQYVASESIIFQKTWKKVDKFLQSSDSVLDTNPNLASQGST